MSKFRLSIEDEYEFIAIGISCHLKDFRVAWMMNRDLGMDFKRETHTTHSKQGDVQDFAMFIHKDPDNRLKYVMLSNYNEEAYFMPQHKQYDFFLFIEGYIEIFDLDEFISKIRSIEAIQFISNLPKSDFQRIQYTLFEE